MSKTYRKKPVDVQAMQLTRETFSEVINWLIDEDVDYSYRCDTPGECSGSQDRHTLYLPTLEGEMKVSEGDYIIQGVQGEFYPCKPDIFAETYEEV